MPTNITSLEQLLLLVAGGILWWLGGVIKKWLSDVTARRRSEVDNKARMERKLRESQEEVYALRAAMLKSGHWTLEDLDEFHRRNGNTPTEP